MTILERLLLFAQSRNLSVNAFEKTLGKAHSYFSQVKSVSSEVVQKACEVYPELSAEWLIRGNGSMIIGEADSSGSQIVTSAEEIRKKDHKIELLIEDLAIAQDKIIELRIQNRILTENQKR